MIGRRDWWSGWLGKYKDHVINALADEDPVKFEEHRGDVLTGRGVAKEPSSTVLDVLQPVNGLVRCPHKKGVAVVQTGGYESVDEALYSRL